jgi:hypothetical protein
VAAVDAASARELAREMEAVAATLRRHSLVELWLSALLANEGRGMPGWSGVVLRRPAAVSSRALDQLLLPEDVDQVLAAWEVAEEPQTRSSLMTLAGGLALELFMAPSRVQGKGWTADRPRDAERRLRAWLEHRCRSDSSELLAARLSAAVGVAVSPHGAGACLAWEEVLLRGQPSWWAAAARELYRCGGPPVALSILRPETQENKERRAFLLGWFGITFERGGR